MDWEYVYIVLYVCMQVRMVIHVGVSACLKSIYSYVIIIALQMEIHVHVRTADCGSILITLI